MKIVSFLCRLMLVELVLLVMSPILLMVMLAICCEHPPLAEEELVVEQLPSIHEVHQSDIEAGRTLLPVEDLLPVGLQGQLDQVIKLQGREQIDRSALVVLPRKSSPKAERRL